MTAYPREIYLLSPKQLSPETIAVAFAKTSRSPDSFRQIARELTDEKSAEFHERWVVGYGHASVAEHAVLHVAFENVSRLAIECIESNRLASYTEKSTRYQQWAPDAFYTPAELERGELYRGTCGMLFRTYAESLDAVRAVVQGQVPRREGESDARWDGRIRSRYVDVCRFLLPASALANVGMTANARVFEHAIRKMLSHPLSEVRQIGAEVKSVTLAEAPTLVKYADRVPYMEDSAAALRRWGGEVPASGDGDWLRLAAHDPEAETRFLASALYRFSGTTFEQAESWVRAAEPEQRAALLKDCLGRRGPFDAPLRELEHVVYTFDALMDQGAYFEVKRHRMMSQTPQRLDCRHGFATPRLMEEAGRGAEYREAMERAAKAYERIAAGLPEEASYVVPNGFNRRLLMTMNLREAFHFCELRSAPSAHFSVRRLALRMAEVIREVHPALAAYMRLDGRPGWREVEEECFVG